MNDTPLVVVRAEPLLLRFGLIAWSLVLCNIAYRNTSARASLHLDGPCDMACWTICACLVLCAAAMAVPRTYLPRIDVLAWAGAVLVAAVIWTSRALPGSEFGLRSVFIAFGGVTPVLYRRALRQRHEQAQRRVRRVMAHDS